MNLYQGTFLYIKQLPSVFWIVILANLINQAGNMGMVFLVVYANQYLGLSVTQGTAAFAVLSASMLVSGLLSGNIIDRIGAARIMIGAIALNGFILLIISLIRNYYALLFMCVLWGISFGAYRPSSQTLIGSLSTKRLHKITFSIYRWALNLGMSIGPAVGGYLVAYSFPLCYVVNGIANVIACLILLAGLVGTKWIKAPVSIAQKRVFTLRWLQHDAMLRLFVLGMIPVTMVFFQHESTLSVYLKQNLGFPLSFYGWMFTINTLMIVFLELFLNMITLNWPYRWNFMIGALFLTMGFAGIYFATSMLHIILLTMLWTIGEMLLFPSASSYIADLAPEDRRGSYMSIYSTCSNLGMLLGPLSGAFVMQHLGGKSLWAICGIVGLVSIIIFSFLSEPKSFSTNITKHV
jgi:MFS family permease